MPWNDTRKPAAKPGPWDAPAQGDAGDQTGEPASGKARRPRQGAGGPPSRDGPGPLTPWGREAPTTKRPEARHTPPRDKTEPSAPPQRGPHLDELGRQLRARLAQAALHPSGRGVRRSVLAGGAGAVALAWALSGVYLVPAGEQAVVTRFGQVVGEAGPGLQYHLPAPIEVVRRLPVGVTNRLDLGSGADDAASQMLTSEGDLADVAFTVQWRIADPQRYLVGLADPDASLRSASEDAMREAVRRTPLADLLSTGHGEAGVRAAALLQAALDRDRAGVQVVGVSLRDVQPPDAAQAGFHDVAAAAEEARTALRDATAYRARVVAEAHADAAKTVQTSQGYRDQEVSEAKGEATRFALVDAQYRKAPQATRDRLYTETMERVLHNANKIIVQTPKGASASIVLPAEAFRPRMTGAGQSPGAPPAASAGPASPQASPGQDGGGSAAPQAPAAAASGTTL